MEAVRQSLMAIRVAEDFRNSPIVHPRAERIAQQSHGPPLGSSLSPAIPLRV